MFFNSSDVNSVKVTQNEPDQKNKVLQYYRIGDFMQYGKPSLEAFQAFKDACAYGGIKLTKSDNYNNAALVMFEHQNRVDEAIPKLVLPLNAKFVYGLGGTDYMASKSALVHMIRQSQGLHIAGEILPESYIVSDEGDMNMLSHQDHIAGEVFIMKKNIQRQEGHYVTSDLDYVIKHANEYVVVQKMLQDPLTISGHKVNMRVYMLVVVEPQTSHASFYVYRDGFMYYTPKPFKKYSQDRDEIITTGYIDRKIYELNPLTHKDLENALGSIAYNKLVGNIDYALRHVRETYSGLLAHVNNIPNLKRTVKFSIYGVDIAPDSNLGCTIMEINKGPDLSYKDDRDKAVKLNMVLDALRIVGMLERQGKDSLGGFRQL